MRTMRTKRSREADARIQRLNDANETGLWDGVRIHLLRSSPRWLDLSRAFSAVAVAVDVVTIMIHDRTLLGG
jgi:hypothetical protein